MRRTGTLICRPFAVSGSAPRAFARRQRPRAPRTDSVCLNSVRSWRCAVASAPAMRSFASGGYDDVIDVPPEEVQQHMQRVAGLLQSGRFSDALKVLETLQEKFPDDQHLLRLQAFALVQQAMVPMRSSTARLQSAEESPTERRDRLLRAALETYGKVTHVTIADYVMMAQAVLELGREDAAAALIDEAIEASLHDRSQVELSVDVLLTAVGVVFRSPKLLASHGVKLVDSILELSPDNIRALGCKALVLGYQGRNDETLAAAEAGLKQNKRDPTCLLGKAIGLSNMGRIQDAGLVALECLSCENVSVEIQSQAMAVVGISCAARSNGTDTALLDEAEERLERALLLLPSNDVAALQLCSLRFTRQRPIYEILKPLNMLLDANPSHLSAMMSKSEILARFGATDEALRALDVLNEFYPRHVPALQIKFLLLYRAGRDHEAIAAIDMAIETADTKLPLLVAKAMPLVRLGYVRDARLLLDEAAAKIDLSEPMHRTVACNVGLVLHNIGDSDAADAWVTRVLSKEPGHVLGNICKVWMSEEPLNKSYWARRALEDHPTNADALWALGVALEYLGFPTDGALSQSLAAGQQPGVSFAFAKQAESAEPQEMRLLPQENEEEKQ